MDEWLPDPEFSAEFRDFVAQVRWGAHTFVCECVWGTSPTCLLDGFERGRTKGCAGWLIVCVMVCVVSRGRLR